MIIAYRFKKSNQLQNSTKIFIPKFNWTAELKKSEDLAVSLIREKQDKIS